MNTETDVKQTNVEITEQGQYAIASQWQLMWWRFLKHRLAILGGSVLIILYTLALFAGFFAPYKPFDYHAAYSYAPPKKVHFVSEEGFQLRPFVYGWEKKIDMETFTTTYEENTGEKYPIYLFVHGSEYKFLGLFKTDLRLFGTDKGQGHVFLFGTDKMGRDVFSRVLFGARVSLTIGLVGVILSFVLGLIMGGISGYYGGAIDNFIQRIIEILRSFPSLPLWMALSAALPPDWSPIKVYFGITIVLSVIGWTGLARTARGMVLSAKTEDYVMAARLVGSSEARIIGRHIIPSFMSYIIAQLTLAIPGMILGETSLSFLGIGLRPPVVSWGVLLQQAQNVQTLDLNPWLMVPGVFVIITVLSFNFLGDGLRDAADPYGM